MESIPQEDKNFCKRNDFGLTLPFALVLTFIFSALVSVAYLFVSINLRQMYTNYQSIQAISIAEGINERIKARLNTKSKIEISPQQEEKLKLGQEEESFDEEGEDAEEDEAVAEDEFNEDVEDFDEYYADEIVKISRYITFREPEQKKEEKEITPTPENPEVPAPPEKPNPLANVEMIGSIDIPRGTVLNKGTKIVIFKDEKINLKLDDILDEGKLQKPKLPIPVIKSLIPNYCEVNSRASALLSGDNLPYSKTARFSKKEITVEDIKAGPTVKFLVGEEI